MLVPERGGNENGVNAHHRCLPEASWSAAAPPCGARSSPEQCGRAPQLQQPLLCDFCCRPTLAEPQNLHN